MNRVLVTGGAGFIGSAVVRHLITKTECFVLSVDKLTYAGNTDSLLAVADSNRHRLARADIGDAPALHALIRDFHPDTVLHLAAESHVDRSIDDPTEFIRTNVVGTFTVLQESLDYFRSLGTDGAREFRFVNVSTDEVFGSLDDSGHFTEETPYRPNSPYSATKAAADHLARAWQRTYGLPVLTTNCSNNYGPYQYPEKLIPLMIENARKCKPLPVYGRGEMVRDWVYVGDHVEALLCVAARGVPGQTYNIGGRNQHRNIDVVRAVCMTLDELVPHPSVRDRRNLIRYVADRPGHDRRYAIDCSKIERELGWRPRESFETGLRKTVEWYLKNQWWCDRIQFASHRDERQKLGAKD